MSEETTTAPDESQGQTEKFLRLDDRGQVLEETPIPLKAQPQSDPKFYTEDDLEKVRKQEKDKMYKRLETMQEQVARLEKERLEREESIQAEQRKKQEEAERKKREEMSTKDLLEQKEREWQAKVQEIEAQMEAERALRQREAEFNSLMEYRQQVLQQYSDRVAPELLDLIQGDSPEQIAQAAEDMAARTERILAQTQEAMQTVRQQTPTARITDPASGDNSGSNTRVMSPDEIRSMSMADYAKHRQRLLGDGASGPKSRGLFG